MNTDFRIFRPLRDDPCDSRRSKRFFWGGGLVGYCMMFEIAQMALSYGLGRCRVIAVWAESAWGKTILSPSLEKHVLTQNGLHKIISAARQSKIRQETEPYWVGLSVRYL